MNIAKLPETLDLPKVGALRKASLYFYEEGNAKNFTDSATRLHFDTVTDFVDYLNSPEVGIPKGTSAKHIGITLEQWYETLTRGETTTTESPQYQPPTESNIPQKGLREVQEGERLIREKALSEAREKGVAQTEKFLDQQQKIAGKRKEIQENIEKLNAAEEKLKQEKIGVKLEGKPSAIKLEGKEAEVYETIKKSVANPEKFVEDAAPIIEDRVSKNSPDSVLKEEIGISSKGAAYAIAQELSIKNAVESGDVNLIEGAIKTPYIQSVITEKIQTGPVLNSKPEIKTEFQKFTELAIEEKALRDLGERYVRAAFGNQLADKIFENTIEVQVSSSPQKGFIESDLSFGPRYQINQFGNQSELLRSVAESGKEITIDTLKPEIYSRAVGWIESKAALLPSNSALAKLYSSKALQLGLSSLKYGVPIEWAGTNAFGRIAVATGYGPTLGWAGQMTGLDLGVGVATGTTVALSASSYAATATKIATTGGILQSEAFLGGAGTAMAGKFAGKAATKVGLGATITAAFAWTGPLAPVIGAVVGFVVGDLIVKIGSKILSWLKSFINKNKELLFGLGAMGMLFGGAPLRIISAIPLIAGGAALLGAGGFSAAVLGGGILRFFGILGRNLAITIGTPIIIAILVFPVVVALILFIINSGAYIVPPSPLTITGGSTITSPYIDVTKTPIPPGPFQNSDLPLTVEYQIQIKAKKGPLQNVRVGYECNVVKTDSSTECPDPEPPIPSTTNPISPSQAFSFSYTQTYDQTNFQDSLIADTITITADVAEQPNAEAAASAGVKIGNPPDTCPSGWPISGSRTITQTPGGGYSHAGIEAIDIGDTPPGVAVKATHSGVATVVRTSGAYRPMYIDIVSNCGASTVTTRYAHLSGTTISNGQVVTMGQTIGSSGSDGSGPHLHYEFRGLRMDLPYIPADEFIRNCSDNSGRCGTTGVKLR